jgi:hypothetical protein
MDKKLLHHVAKAFFDHEQGIPSDDPCRLTWDECVSYANMAHENYDICYEVMYEDSLEKAEISLKAVNSYKHPEVKEWTTAPAPAFDPSLPEFPTCGAAGYYDINGTMYHFEKGDVMRPTQNMDKEYAEENRQWQEAIDNAPDYTTKALDTIANQKDMNQKEEHQLQGLRDQQRWTKTSEEK